VAPAIGGFGRSPPSTSHVLSSHANIHTLIRNWTTLFHLQSSQTSPVVGREYSQILIHLDPTPFAKGESVRPYSEVSIQATSTFICITNSILERLLIRGLLIPRVHCMLRSITTIRQGQLHHLSFMSTISASLYPSPIVR